MENILTDEILIFAVILIICTVIGIAVTLCIQYRDSLAKVLNYHPKKSKSKSSKDFRYTDEMSSSITVFACDRLPIKMVELIDGKGLFPMGVKAIFDIPKLPEQVKLSKKLEYVNNVSPKLSKASINLGKYGKYDVGVSSLPTARRLDSKYMASNPFISSGGNRICLGTSESLYNKCYLNNDKFSCLKIIQEVLSCDDDSEGYRRWCNCI